MGINVEIVPVPVTPRARNEYDELVAGLAKASAEAEEAVAGRFSLHVDVADRELKKARAAANDAGWSLKHTRGDADKKTGEVVITAWLVSKIERPRKAKADKAE